LSRPISLSKRYDTDSIRNECRDAQLRLSQIFQGDQETKHSDLIAALIKFRSLKKYELALGKWEFYVNELYIEASSKNASFTTDVLDNSSQVLKTLNSHFRRDHLFLEVPDACPGESDNFMFVWNKGEHYLECEIFGNGAVEFFYKNRSSDEVWGEDTTVDEKLTSAILKKLILFVSAER